jgi:hypothetical protein
LAAVRAQRPLVEIEAMSCPCCGSRISVRFSPKGDGFHVACCGEPPHLSTYQEVTKLPAWWEERIVETGPITFYWHKDSQFGNDGRLEMPASGYDGNSCHWSGRMILRPGQPDYLLWRWVIGQGDRYKPLISDKDLEAIREEFRQIADPGPAPEPPCE